MDYYEDSPEEDSGFGVLAEALVEHADREVREAETRLGVSLMQHQREAAVSYRVLHGFHALRRGAGKTFLLNFMRDANFGDTNG